MALFALRNIQPFEELSYDYNFSLFNPAEGQPCKCRSTQCRGVIGKSRIYYLFFVLVTSLLQVRVLIWKMLELEDKHF